MGRWAARIQRNADRRDERYREHQEAVRSGKEAPSLGDRLSTSMQGSVAADARRFEQYHQLLELLSNGPVSGPDGIPVLICFSESLITSSPPKLQMPDRWLRALAGETTPTGRVAMLESVMGNPRIAYAYAMSGPPMQLIHHFQDSRFSPEDPVGYVLSLADAVRARGVSALNQA